MTHNLNRTTPSGLTYAQIDACNTDAKSLMGDRRFSVLVQQGIAVTSGDISFGRKLGNLRPDDRLLMCENRMGVVAVGTVLERWDRQEHAEPLYYISGNSFRDGADHEYRIKVEWFLDLTNNPISYDEAVALTGSKPSTTLKRISNTQKIEARIQELCLVAAPLTQPAVDTDQPERIETTTYRILRDTCLARRVKALHRFECHICGHAIRLPGGLCYAEAHHIRPLGGGRRGHDRMGNILCVCPNHHAEFDYGVSRIDLASLRKADGRQVDPQYVEYHNTKICRLGSGCLLSNRMP